MIFEGQRHRKGLKNVFNKIIAKRDPDNNYMDIKRMGPIRLPGRILSQTYDWQIIKSLILGENSKFCKEKRTKSHLRESSIH